MKNPDIINVKNIGLTSMHEIANRLVDGKIVIFPTDTCYGLITNALNHKSVSNIFTLKKRSVKNPLYIALSSVEMANSYLLLSDKEKELLKYFKERALTIITKPKNQEFSELLKNSNNKIGGRIPNHALLKQIIELANVPVTATSANLSGRNNPYTIKEIFNQYRKRELDFVDLIIDGGILSQSPVSTIIELDDKKYKILRDGDVSNEEIEKWLLDKI